ncbi:MULTISPECIES: helix-turn-helix transcriptional regulator [Nocardia]|uniref:helix-turn-helix transcriptional regulator n=1 Tax=Nocardia TaxID=1817 RepID=UPI000A56011C|nr:MULTISPECIES: helix-turn-helix transcriptional regulator [Nocardia]
MPTTPNLVRAGIEARRAAKPKVCSTVSVTLDLSQIRTALDLTQVEIAGLVGVSDAYWSMLERGHRQASNELLTKVLGLFRHKLGI